MTDDKEEQPQPRRDRINIWDIVIGVCITVGDLLEGFVEAISDIDLPED